MRHGRAGRRVPVVLLLIYIGFIVYGSLFPFHGWEAPGAPALSLIWRHGLYAGDADILTNILVYVPLGAFLMWARRGRRAIVGGAVAAAIVGVVLSTGVEWAQAWLPSRVPSILDVALNTSGAFCGALFAATVSQHFTSTSPAMAYVKKHFRTGSPAVLGFVALGVWVLSQLSPGVPSIDIGTLEEGLRPLWIELQQQAFNEPIRAVVYALALSGLGLLSTTLVKGDYPIRRLYALCVAVVLLLKVPIVLRQLSLEAVAGLVVAMVVLGILCRLGRRTSAWVAMILLVGALLVEELRAGSGALTPFNWMPFAEQFTHPLPGIAGMLGTIWLFIGLAYLGSSCRGRASLGLAIVGALCVFATVFGLEWHQRLLPGRYGDITDALVATGAWLLSLMLVKAESVEPSKTSDARSASPHRRCDIEVT